ncbi:MAG: hypothetical protein N5P05_003581 [Chroococcopsis gigantea SAG 12.99]|nr:hypothetical protein [Chroococcopsis gigantea SAG 12.99]
MSIDSEKTEHFCTLFDSNFLPIGITLHSSLMIHAQPFYLWIICMDNEVEKHLKLLNLPQVSLISLSEIENSELLSVKKERSQAEYCWTLTPFTFTNVFDIEPSIERVTYIDADLFFFDDPRFLLRELSESERSILITEHAYDPLYDQTLTSGKFCVQFITAKNNERALRVIHWWQKKCVEWCFNRLEDGKFGDQKYLDVWPTLFTDDIWIVQQKERTLAPWNINYFESKLDSNLRPVFYHFHGLRMINDKNILLSINYPISRYGLKLYKTYVKYLKINLALLLSKK